MTIPDGDSELTPQEPPKNEEQKSNDKSIGELVEQFVEAMEDGARAMRESRQQELLDLYDGEEFQNEGLTYNADIAAYDQTAYTKTREENLESYRYNLKTGFYAGTQVPAESFVNAENDPSSLLDDAGISTGDEDSNAEDQVYRTGQTVYGGYGSSYSAYSGKSGAYSYGYGAKGSYGGWLSGSAYGGTGSWMNSWYSGYTSTGSALKAVHQNVGTFIEKTDNVILELIPDLEAPRGNPVDAQIQHDKEAASKTSSFSQNYSYSSLYRESCKTYAIRIDSTLYEKLGLEEAQQHYIVDGISQVLALQQYPDPAVLAYIHSCRVGEEGDMPPHSSLSITIPNVLRELITEITRAAGVPLLLERMPGWQKRVNAFRSVMYIGEPPNNDIPTAYLMYAVWERDAVETLEHQDALEVIDKVEAILKEPLSSPDLTVNERHGERVERVHAIQREIVRYITGFGPIGRIVESLHNLKSDLIKIKNSAPPRVATQAEADDIKAACDQIIPMIHDHNRTFCPDPSKPKEIRHQDFPECPSRELLPEQVRKRYELSRLSVFTLNGAPGLSSRTDIDEEGVESQKYLDKAIKQIQRLLDELGNGGDPRGKQLEAAEEAAAKARSALQGISDAMSNSVSADKSSVNCTKHPELRHRGSVGNGVDRNFNTEDPELSRKVVIYDLTIS